MTVKWYQHQNDVYSN